jgi:CDP-diacylglycerol---glycerol-3-phosphate 3-phosphatidyltransferase
VDTFFWPVIQAGALGLHEEEKAMDRLWEAVDENVQVDLTSGYFGLYGGYKKAILDSKAPFKIIAASPEANGFYKSAGVSSLIPEGYTLLESRFHRDTVSRGRAWDDQTHTGIRLKEWKREGWTYHSKGIWVSRPSSSPFMTFVGSSNLSNRSLNLDTELSLYLLTSSTALRKSMSKEVANLDKHAEVVGEETWRLPDRRVSWAAWLLTAFGVEGML